MTTSSIIDPTASALPKKLPWYRKLGMQVLVSLILGILVGLGCLLPFYIARAMGAGDVKLLAATGALLGPYDALIAGICTLPDRCE